MTQPNTPTAKVRFVRKPCDLQEVLAICSAVDKPAYPVSVEFQQTLTTREYDLFGQTLLKDRDWLKGRGGWLDNEVRRVVEVSAPDRTTLYVDPSGSAFGRYVGIAV